MNRLSRVLAVALGLWSFGAHADAVHWHSCPDLSLDRFGLHDPDLRAAAADPTLRCGEFSVFENRLAGRGKKIALRIVVAPASARDPDPDPVFVFAGGPGEGAAEQTAWFVRQLKKTRERRTLVFVDARGTGASEPLRCPTPATTMQDAVNGHLTHDIVRTCLATLTQKADLTQYTTADVVDDVDELREALGYKLINLKGSSYASRVGLEYLRRHPEHVRSAFLSAFAPSFQTMPASFARDFEEAFWQLVERCEQDLRCHAAFPLLRDEVAGLRRTLQRGPIQASVTNPATGKHESITFTQGTFFAPLRSMMYSMDEAATVPRLIHEAANNHFDSLAQHMYHEHILLGEAISYGFYLSSECSEDVPFIDPARAYDEAKGTLVGDYFLREDLNACGIWPKRSMSADSIRPVSSLLPVLMMTGANDPDTRPRWGEMSSYYLPNSLHVVVPNASHFLTEGWDQCLSNIVNDFYVRATTENLDVSCVRNIPPTAFDTGRP